MTPFQLALFLGLLRHAAVIGGLALLPVAFPG